MTREEDIAELHSIIRDFWPDLGVSKGDLRKPTADFVFRFFTKFVSELSQKLMIITNAESSFIDVGGSTEFGQTVDLFCKVTRIWKYFGVTTEPILTDFYNPFPKRMFQFFTVATHFMYSVHDSTEDVAARYNEVACEADRLKQLEEMKQSLKSDINKIALDIGLEKERSDRLDSKLRATKLQHENMMLERAARQKQHKQKSAEIEVLSKECESLEYTLKSLDVEESALIDQVVSDEQFKNLKATEGELQSFGEDLQRQIDGYIDGIKSSDSTIKHLNECAATLRSINVDSLDFQRKSELSQKISEAEQTETNLEKSLTSCSKQIKDKKLHVKNLLNTLDETLKKKQDISKKCEIETQEDKRIYQEKKKAHASAVQEYYGIQKEISNLNNEICAVNAEKQVAHEEFSKAYSTMMEAESSSTVKFKNCLTALLEEAKKADGDRI